MQIFSYLDTVMSIQINVVLDTRYKKKDGSFPVVIRLGEGVSERTLSIPTGISIPQKDWDPKKRQVKTSYKEVTSINKLNNQIEAKKKHARDVILQLEETNQLSALSLTDIKTKIVQNSKSKSFFAFTEKLCNELKEANRIGTKKSYEFAAKALENFIGNKNLDFHQITYEFLCKFETKHFSKGNTANGLAAYLRSIRAIYNKAIKSGIVDEKYYPFRKYTIKTEPTEKRALDWEPLNKIITLELSSDSSLFHARNYFVASYMMYGMNFTDMAFLKTDNLIDGRIMYRRSKTSKLYDIKLTPALKEILDYYISLDLEKGFVFPIIKRDNAENQNKDISWARKRYNAKLKKLAKMCEIEKNLTSYVSRHSFATQAMLQDVPINAISAMLGHSSLKTTQIYLKSLPNNILDSYNEKILLR